jgi:hypothetical protein
VEKERGDDTLFWREIWFFAFFLRKSGFFVKFQKFGKIFEKRVDIGRIVQL